MTQRRLLVNGFLERPVFQAVADWILVPVAPSLPGKQSRGQSVRIEPIHHGREALFFPACDVTRLTGHSVCVTGHSVGRPLFRECTLRAGECRFVSARFVDRNLNRILLGRALAGLLTRMRTFDWQVIHGHQVGGTGGLGATLDLLA
jgi:hypothetical protein